MSEPKAVEFTVDIREQEPREVFFFDRFAVFRRGAFVELHFGFFGGSAELIRGLIAVVQWNIFKETKESFLKYLNLGGEIPDTTDIVPFKVRSPYASVVTADLIGLARHGAVGEITLHALSWKVAIDSAKGATEMPTIKGQFVALLRCDLELQKRWVIAVYDADENED